jgi:peptidoglycan/xylan/chitin deacetylase (PgdA/CDA1 family)
VKRNAALLVLVTFALAARAFSEERRVAVTIDDLPVETALGADEALALTESLLHALRAHRAPATGFVIGRKVLVKDQVDARLALLEKWLDSGMSLGNHTFSHDSLNETALAEYQLDIVQGELLLRFVQEPRGQRLRYFRAPHNHVGPTQEIKDGLARFLRSRRQVLAPFTIEHSDYVFDEAYRSALTASDAVLSARVRAAYLDHLDVVFSFFEGLSAEMFDRQIAQIFLIHANRLNAETLAEMLGRLEGRGYRFIALETALEDEAYSLPDHFVGPVGISWFHRWSYSRGYGARTTASGLSLPETLYREPDPPEFILKAAR